MATKPHSTGLPPNRILVHPFKASQPMSRTILEKALVKGYVAPADPCEQSPSIHSPSDHSIVCCDTFCTYIIQIDIGGEAFAIQRSKAYCRGWKYTHIYMYIIKQSLTGHVIMNTFGLHHILNNCPQGISVYTCVCVFRQHPDNIAGGGTCKGVCSPQGGFRSPVTNAEGSAKDIHPTSFPRISLKAPVTS